MASEGIVAAPAAPTMRRGLVKQVLSGDAVVMLGGARAGGPPEEVTVYLSNVTAPRLGRRPTDSASGTADEPWAWEAREFLRKKLIGQTVTFVKDFTATSSRDHGRVYLGGTCVDNAENVSESAVAAGWLEVRPGKIADDYTNKLLELQEAAKAGKKGRWSENAAGAVREIKWTHTDPRSLVDIYKQKPIDAVIEMVRDGTTVRAFLLPSFDYITLQLSGVRSPSTKGVADGKPEPFAEEAKFFVETRLLQQDVQIVLESTSNANFVGSILHPKGNIAESLLREGMAKCVDWSIGLCTGGAEKLRAAEAQAKERRVRLWRAYVKPAANAGEKKKFEGKVIEIVLNDALVVLLDNGEEKKVHLASVRLPRDGPGERTATGRQFRPLYDVPFMYEAREYLRKRLIGKRAQVTVDYHQAKSEQFPEKTCCTVEIGGKNVAIGLLEKGLSKVVRHRNDDENRSSQYDALLAAEATAEKEKAGVFADAAEASTRTQRVQELQGDLAKSKQFLPYLQRGNHRAEAIVDFITSGSRMRVFVPKETCLITFLLSGISCPKSGRAAGAGQPATAGEPFSAEAMAFTRRLCLHRDVELEVEGLDKQGAFIGYLWVRSDEGRLVNVSELLLEQGLASLHFTAEKSAHYNQLAAAEARAKAARRNLFASYNDDEEKQAAAEEAENRKTERTVNYKKVAVSDVHRGGSTFRFAAQDFADGPAIEKLLSTLRSSIANNPPLASAFSPKRGEVVAAKFSADNQWYRAKIESLKHGVAEVLFIDFGNRESLSVDKLCALPAGCGGAPYAKEYHLALVTVPNDEHYAKSSFETLEQLLFTAPHAELNTEYTAAGTPYVSVIVDIAGERVDVGKALVEDGFGLTDKRKDQRLAGLVAEYTSMEQKARKERRNIWEFGDFTGNDL